MSLLSAVILPLLEKELLALEPEMAKFVTNQLKIFAAEVVEWAENKINIDVNGAGVVGEDKE